MAGGADGRDPTRMIGTSVAAPARVVGFQVRPTLCCLKRGGIPAGFAAATGTGENIGPQGRAAPIDAPLGL